MGDRESVASVAARMGVAGISPNWQGIDAVMPLLERIRSEGGVVVVKLDGQRQGTEACPYTVVVTAGKLPPDDYAHTECATLEDALSQAIVQYAQKCWGHPLSS